MFIVLESYLLFLFQLKERLQNALNNPLLVYRCQEISQIIQDVSNKDATFVLKTVIESIFGIPLDARNITSSNQNSEGWGLRIITLAEHLTEFQALRTFLSPTGPLLNFIYKLCQDPYHVIPFSIALLPVRICFDFLNFSFYFLFF